MMTPFFSRFRRTTPAKKRNRAKSEARPKRPKLLLELLENRTLLSTFTVTNTLDDTNPGSLRWAINQANTDTDPISNIDFNIPGSGTQTISPLSGCPSSPIP
jgi:hypothetical protein